MKIEDLISQVCNANVLVRRDVAPERVGSLWMADTSRSQLKSTSGVVLAVGEGCRSDLREGARIIFGEFAGTAISLEGVESDSSVLFLPDLDVLAILKSDAGEPGEALGLPMEWMDQARAREGMLLVERAEMPLMRGKIHLPPGTKKHTKAQEAVVRSVGRSGLARRRRRLTRTERWRVRLEDILGPLWPFRRVSRFEAVLESTAGFEPGDRVQLANQGGRGIPFGPRGERELCQISPRAVLGKYREAPEGQVLAEPRGFLLPSEMLEEALAPDHQLDEGDSRGPQ